MLSEEQKCVAIAGACFVLRFLVDPENRQNARVQMLGYSDAVYSPSLDEPGLDSARTGGQGSPDTSQLTLLEEFNAVYESYDGFQSIPIQS